MSGDCTEDVNVKEGEVEGNAAPETVREAAVVVKERRQRMMSSCLQSRYEAR